MLLTLPPGKYTRRPRAQIYKQLLEQVKATPACVGRNDSQSTVGSDSFGVWRGVIREGRPMTPDEQNKRTASPGDA